MNFYFINYDSYDDDDDWKYYQHPIDSLEILKTPLSEHQWSSLYMHHQFMIVKSDKWFSFEKLGN